MSGSVVRADPSLRVPMGPGTATTVNTSGLYPVSAEDSLREYLRRTWSRRDLAWAITSSDLRARNMDTVLGGLWYLMNPLLMAGIYLLVFGVVLDARRGIDNYVSFLTIGIFVYHYTGKSLQNGANTIIMNRQLIQTIAFPRALLPVAAVLSETVALGASVLAITAVVLLTGGTLTPSVLLVLPLFVLQALFNLGLTMGTARLTVHFRDMQQLLPYVLRIWLYLSGIFYTSELIPEGLARQLFELNPLYTYISLARTLFLGGGATVRLWIAAAVWALGAVAVGFVFFRGHEAEYGNV